jgi:hypothetical protein
MVAPTCNPSTQEVEAGGWRMQGQPGLHSEKNFLKTPQIFSCNKDMIICICTCISF